MLMAHANICTLYVSLWRVFISFSTSWLFLSFISRQFHFYTIQRVKVNICLYSMFLIFFYTYFNATYNFICTKLSFIGFYALLTRSYLPNIYKSITFIYICTHLLPHNRNSKTKQLIILLFLFDTINCNVLR
jgi:hypothetical protein